MKRAQNRQKRISESRKRLINQHKEKRHENFIDDGSTNIKLAWTENGERRTPSARTASSRNGLRRSVARSRELHA